MPNNIQSSASSPLNASDAAYKNWETGFLGAKKNLRQETIKFIGRIAIIALAALAVAAAAALTCVFAPITLPIIITLIVTAAALTALGVGLSSKIAYDQYSGARTDVEELQFNKLFRLDNGLLSQKKAELFQQYGKDCKKLDLSPDKYLVNYGIKFGAFLDWIKKNGNVKQKGTLEFLQELNTPKNRNLDHIANTLSSIKMSLERLDIEYATIADCDNPVMGSQTERDQERKKSLIKIAQLKATIQKEISTKPIALSPSIAADIISACPNLREVNLAGFAAFKKVQDACKALKLKAKEDELSVIAAVHDLTGIGNY